MSSGASCGPGLGPSTRSTTWSRRRWPGCSKRCARLDDDALGPYAIVTARNLVASHWRRSATNRRNVHRLFDPAQPAPPDEGLVEDEENAAVRDALDRLSHPEREMLIAHEVDGQPTADLADEAGSTAGAIAARLNRSRAKLRVEYLLVLAGEPPSDRCRPIAAVALGRQPPAAGRARRRLPPAGVRVLRRAQRIGVRPAIEGRRRRGTRPVRADADVVAARQRGRELAIRGRLRADRCDDDRHRRLRDRPQRRALRPAGRDGDGDRQ